MPTPIGHISITGPLTWVFVSDEQIVATVSSDLDIQGHYLPEASSSIL